MNEMKKLVNVIGSGEVQLRLFLSLDSRQSIGDCHVLTCLNLPIKVDRGKVPDSLLIARVVFCMKYCVALKHAGKLIGYSPTKGLLLAMGDFGTT